MDSIIMTATVTLGGKVTISVSPSLTLLDQCGALMDLQMAAAARSNICDQMYADASQAPPCAA